MTTEATRDNAGVFGGDRLSRVNAIAQSRYDEKEEAGAYDEDAETAFSRRADALNAELADLSSEGEDESDEGYQDDQEPEDDEGDDQDTQDDDDPEGSEEEESEDEGEEEESPEDATTPQSEKYILKINGVEQEFTREQVIARAQKVAAADAYLAEASERLKQAQGQAVQPRQPSTQDVDEARSKELKTLTRQYHEALVDGDDNRADELLIQIQSQGRPQTQPTFDPEQIAETIERRQTERTRQREVADAKAFFDTQYADIAGDPSLYSLADQFTVKVMQENPHLSPIEVVTEAGDRTRAWLAEKTGATKKTEDKQTRTNRKKSIATPRSNGAKRPGPPPVKRKTRTDALNDIRRMRGQAPRED
ncbi:hypothetical protein [Hahella ganghwensis]|uniref:hypothetical protein n=1 Tax=Hahella ganghwensis TaxID=286420 RepID=UPI0003802CCA|nr:hypothetical protein [Hahella ganghwensis]